MYLEESEMDSLTFVWYLKQISMVQHFHQLWGKNRLWKEWPRFIEI